MSDDEGEMFFLQDWQFADTDQRGQRISVEHYANSSMPRPLLAPIARHSNHERQYSSPLRRDLSPRDFTCPHDTHSCSAIGEDDLCCNPGETCVSTYGGVGCCPNGEDCGSVVAECDTSQGYISCPNSPGGGCCLLGSSCEGTGCIVYKTRTVTLTLSTSTKTTGAIFRTETSSGRVVTVAFPTTETVVSPYTTTQTVVLSNGGSTCSAGFFSCAASLGGGCCANGQICGAGTHCHDVSVSSTASINAPVTAQAAPSTTTTATIMATTTPNICAIGYYQCSAHYIGCCRVGRNCDTTSCPSLDSSTILNSGVTIVASAPTPVRGACASGWSSCPASANGGCCPSDHACGTGNTCLATTAGQQAVVKEIPSNATLLGCASGFLVIGIVAAVGMIWM